MISPSTRGQEDRNKETHDIQKENREEDHDKSTKTEHCNDDNNYFENNNYEGFFNYKVIFSENYRPRPVFFPAQKLNQIQLVHQPGTS